MSVNSDLKNFAIFVNSKAAVVRDSYKAEVTIPFTANLAEHDPMKVFTVSFVDMLFTNSFYNVRDNYNKLQVLVQYAAGRGKPASYEIIQVDVPNAFYDYDTLVSYYNGTLGETEDVTLTYASSSAPITIYKGYGALPAPGATNPGSDAAVSDTSIGRIIIQTPTIGILTQPGTDLNTTPTNSATLKHSYIYQGIYLLANSTTDGMLKTLGFFNDLAEIPTIPNSIYNGQPPLRGYGISLAARQKNSSGLPSANYTEYGFVNGNTILWNDNTQGAPYDQDEAVGRTIPYNFTDLSGLDEVYVHCPQMRTQFQSSIARSKLAPSDVIAVIPINVPYGSKMSYVPQFQLKSTLINTNITQLDFRITNSNNELLDFQGINWSLTMFAQEEEDTSRYQFEALGTSVTPFQIQQNQKSGTSYMEERVARKRRNLLL